MVENGQDECSEMVEVTYDFKRLKTGQFEIRFLRYSIGSQLNGPAVYTESDVQNGVCGRERGTLGVEPKVGYQ